MGRYLVTGGGGFIGSHLVEALARAGHDVAVLDDFSTGRPDNLAAVPATVEAVDGDVRDADAVADAASGADGIFHLAALNSMVRSFEDPAATLATNVGGTVAVVDAARRKGVRRIVLASSSSVYGGAARVVRRESDSVAPLSPYAESKVAAERVCLGASADGDPEAVCLRYFNVYGPRQDPASPYAAAIPRFASSFLRDEPPEIYGDGKQTRDFTFIADVVEATRAAMSVPAAAGRVMNVGAGRRTSVNRLAELIGDLVGSRAGVRRAPPRRGEVRHAVADVSLAREVLCYRPRWTLAEGLRPTVAWYRDRLEVKPA